MNPGGMNDMGGILRQAQKMQKEMAKAQESLKERVVEGTAGGGVVKVHVNCAQEVLSFKLDPEAVDPEDVEMLEDLLLAATAQAMKKAADIKEEEMGRITGGLGLPGLGF